MEITQRDRDSLRQAQQKLNSSEPFRIGNIVEHKIQDPAKYKALSRQEQGLSKDDIPSLPKINYNSIHLDSKKTVERSSSQTKEPNQMNPNQVDLNHDGTIDDEGPNPMPVIQEKDELHMGLPITPGDVQANLWLNMDRVEFEKLEWMSTKADREYQAKLRSSTHFDCDGKAIPSPASDTELQPHQPVHDISSLVKLLDSAYQPQVTYALTVISKIAARATIGLYDAVFDENIHQILLKECLLRVRHHVDSPNETICQGALKCLRSLLCNTQIDEVFLDKLSPITSEKSDTNMWLCCNEENFNIDMKDNECVHSDAILGLIARTDILARFKYLLNTKIDPKFSRTYQDCIFDILIRIARHSPDICWIINNSEFPKLIIEHFLPVDVVRKDHQQQSLALRGIKFLRIIAQAARELKQSNSQCLNGPVIKLPNSIVQIINAYYYLDCCGGDLTNDVLFRIQIETLRLMKLLSSLTEFSGHIFSTLSLEQSSLVNHVRSLTQLSVLKPIISTSSLDWQYASALLNLMGAMLNHERLNSASYFIQPLWANFMRPQTLQWFNDITRDKIVPHQDISIALYVAAEIFHKSRDEHAIADLYTILFQHSYKIKDPSTDTSLQYFRHLVREATNGSQLYNFHEVNGRRRDPVMLQSYGFMDFNTSSQYSYKLNSIIGTNSPYILLNLYFDILRRSCTRFDNLLPYYIDNVDIVRYMRTATFYHKYPVSYESEVQRSVLAQLEVGILANATLLLSKHYLRDPNDNDYNPTELQESQDLANSRCECYSQLVLDVVSIIGLINPDIEHMLKLKDALLEKMVFSDCLHSRLVREAYKHSIEVHKHMKFNELNRFKYDGETTENFSLNEIDLLVMKSVYLSCEQPGRFWIFQPLIEYYCCQIQDCDETKRVKDGKWFLQNINKTKHHGRLLPADCSDVDVINQVLRLNVSLMHQSPSYFQVVVKQNIEEYLCLIGSVFLDDDLFLDGKITRVLWHNLELILTTGLKHGVDALFCDASKKISTLNLPLVDFFNKLVDQYEAASYNDVVFTNFILLFLSPKCDRIFRRKLFSDKLETCLSQMCIAQSEVWIPEDFLTKDKESDPEIKCLIKLSGPHIRKSTFLDYYRRYHVL